MKAHDTNIESESQCNDCKGYEKEFARLKKHNDQAKNEVYRLEAENEKLVRQIQEQERLDRLDSETNTREIARLKELLVSERLEFGRLNIGFVNWLKIYRDNLKKTNVFHKNEALINEINELLK